MTVDHIIHAINDLSFNDLKKVIKGLRLDTKAKLYSLIKYDVTSKIRKNYETTDGEISS